jgi:predicted ATP-grasp superfamily ATP-dependent carboligase
MISTVCILGDHIQSLGVARIAGRLGYKVIVMNSDRICITRFSKFCNKFILFKNDDELLRGLVQLYKGERDILLMPTNDKLVKFIIENYDFLLPKFYIS